jgi:hypothetical protein
MLTLKIITTNIDDVSQVYIFTGDIISHKEYFSDDHYLAKKKVEENNTIWYIGSLIESSSKQKFTASDIEIFDEDRVCKNIIFVTAKADCYIMENGKTIDSFFLTYEQ